MNQRDPQSAKLRRPLGDVLVATDFSVSAGHAVARAAQLPIT
jgi:hypothetical protein